MGILPSSAAFFDHFAAQAKLVRAAVDLLVSAEENRASEAHEKILGYEAQCQEIGDRTLTALRTTFLTPLDRDDLFAILTSLEAMSSAVAAAATANAASTEHAILEPLRLATRDAVHVTCDAVMKLKDEKAHDEVRALCDRARKATRVAEHRRRGALATLLREAPPHLADVIACDAFGQITKCAFTSTDAVEAALLDA